MSLKDEVIELMDELERLIREIERGRMEKQEILRRLREIYSEFEELKFE